jgi:hypothetical protein
MSIRVGGSRIIVFSLPALDAADRVAPWLLRVDGTIDDASCLGRARRLTCSQQ